MTWHHTHCLDLAILLLIAAATEAQPPPLLSEPVTAALAEDFSGEAAHWTVGTSEGDYAGLIAGPEARSWQRRIVMSSISVEGGRMATDPVTASKRRRCLVAFLQH